MIKLWKLQLQPFFSRTFKLNPTGSKKTLTPEIFKELIEKETEILQETNHTVRPLRLFEYLKWPYLYDIKFESKQSPGDQKSGNNPDSATNQAANESPIKPAWSFSNMDIFVFGLGVFCYFIYTNFTKNDIKNLSEQTSISKEPHKHKTTPKVTFKDIKGIDEILPEFEELIRYMKNPEEYNKMGAKIPKGILLTGSPGVGKTYLARALATESDWNFIYKSGSEFDDKYVGEGARKIREMFASARESKPTIIFIDELDSVAGKREYDFAFSSQTINQLLTEMDGFSSDDDILIIGATNLEESLDKAVLRPGRFDKTINVPLPTLKGRKEILQLYVSKIKHSENINIDKYSKRTVGMSPADLKNLVNTAAIRAVKLGKEITTEEEIDYAYDRILMGIKSSNKGFGFTKNDIRSIAIHEVGHTLAAIWNNAAMDVHKVTVLSVGGSLGSTSLVPKVEEENMTKRNVIAQLDVALGGRAAEEVYLGLDKVTTGCSDDMSKATKIAYDYFASYGLDDNSFLAFEDLKKLSEDQKYNIENQVNGLLNERYAKVKQQFESNRGVFMKIVDELVEKETMSKDEVMRILND